MRRRNTTSPPRPSRTSIPEADWTPNHVRESAALCYRLAERAQIDGDTTMALRLAACAQGAAVSRAALSAHLVAAGVGNVTAALRRVDQLATGELARYAMRGRRYKQGRIRPVVVSWRSVRRAS